MWWFFRPKYKQQQRDGVEKPNGFLARLGNLIVLQCLFVFVALGLLLFYSSDDISDNGAGVHTQFVVRELGKRITEQYVIGETFSDIESSGLRDQLQVSSEGIESAALFVVENPDSVRCLQALGPTLLTTNATLPPGGGSQLSLELITHVACEPQGFMLSSIYNSEQTIFYYRPEVPGDFPAVFAALVNHDLLISRRSELQYAVLLLFLVSILLSLMTVYLIWKRFRQPLVHLIRRLEKTADGEVYYQLETEGDIELNVLSGTFNKIAKTLWSNQQEMKSYNSQLREINSSLLESRLFLATLIDSSPSSIVVTSADGEIIIFNREASRTFGYESDVALGRPIRELFKQPFAMKAPDEANGERGFEAISLRADGAAFPVYVVATPVHLQDGGIWAFVYVIHDISESKSFQEMMIRLDRYSTRGEMAGDIAHEINNYLAVLSGNLELFPLLLKKGDPDKIAAKLDVMRNTVDRIARFADGLMDTNRDELTLELISINQVVENVLAFLRPQNKFDHTEFITELDTNIPFIHADPGQIQQLLVNLINNAADAMVNETTGRVITISTNVAADAEGRQLAQIHVRDTGPGVPEDKIEALFSRRFTTKRKGHGIGLITCKRIVEAHGGEISYQWHNGARFTCSLPCERRERALETDPPTLEPDVLVKA